MLLAAIAMSTAPIFTSCSPKKEAAPVVKQEEEEAESTKDANDTREETDAVLDEANQVMNDNKSKYGRADADTVNIGAKSVTITSNSITIVYENTKSKDLKRTKTGTVVITRIGDKKFHEVDGSFSIEYKDLKITRTLDQKNITINGKHVIKNVTGGYAWAALLFENNAKVTHEISGTINVAFNDATEREWTVSRARSYDYLSISIGQIAGINYIEKGMNRRGNLFVTQVPAGKDVTAQYDAVSKLSKITSGTIEHTVTANTVITKITAVFGYKSLNQPASQFSDVKGYQFYYSRTNVNLGPYFVQTYVL